MTTTRTQKLVNAATRLNADRAKMPDAYRMRRGRIVGFYPCPKSFVFLAALCTPGSFRQDALREPGYADINTETVLSLVEGRAALITCSCHPEATADDLMQMEYQNAS